MCRREDRILMISNSVRAGGSSASGHVRLDLRLLQNAVAVFLQWRELGQRLLYLQRRRTREHIPYPHERDVGQRELHYKLNILVSIIC